MIRIDTRGSVAVLSLEHGKVNALDAPLLERLSEEIDTIAGSPARALVVTGRGGSFSAGVDLWRVLEGGPPYLETFVPLLSDTLSRIISFPKPVVAALNGHAIAGGCVIACACDYRIMSDGKGKIGVPELRVGVPFPPVALEIIRSVVPARFVSRLIYLGALYGPGEALDIGLIDDVVPSENLLAHACDVAERLAAIPSETFRVTKEQLRRPLLDRAAALDRAMHGEVGRIWSSDEVMAAIRAYMKAVVGRSASP